MTVGAGPDEASCAAIIDPLAARNQVPERDVVDLTRPGPVRVAMDQAGLVMTAQTDVAFVHRFDDTDDAIRSQMPAGPVQSAVRRAGREVVEQELQAFFAARRQPDGSVRMQMVFRCTSARRIPVPANAPPQVAGAAA